MKKTKIWKQCRFWLAVCLVLCFVSGLGAATITSDGGKVKVEKLTWLTEQGYKMSGLLYVPENATKETPAPAVITVHGWYNTNAFQDLFDIELSRRGYVVLSPDMIGHGDSDITDWDTLYSDASGINSAVELIASLDYVDIDKIGLTGHSSGGDQAGAALPYDNARDRQLISAILWQSSIWTDDEGINHLSEIGSRQAGVVATQYDEFFYGDVPREFINSEDASDFLGFEGMAPLSENAVAGQYYTANIDGKDAFRVIYAPAFTHPREHFSKTSVEYMLEFFGKAFGEPVEMAVSNQVWPFATFFKTLGLIAWIFVFITFALTMLDTEYFSDLRAKNGFKEPLVQDRSRAGKAWFWVPLIACGLLNSVLFVWVQHKVVIKPTYTNIWPQTSTLGIALWAVLGAVISFAVFMIYYRAYGKNHGYDMKQRGTIIVKEKLGKTILLALLTAVVGFIVLFAVFYFFKTDFRFYLIAARPFNSELFLVALRFMPFFLIAQTVNSLVINGPFYTDIASKKFKHANLVIVIFFNIVGMLILWLIQYVNFYITGRRLFNGTLGILICFIWMVPAIFNTIVTSVLSRTIYKKSGNPYIGAFINGILITFIQCASTTTVLVGLSSSSYLPI